ncbi:MAG: hypothetical protein HQ546_01250, partial [Planctomycetes bacterium]|nr:hypothetical protein [Planctomycetota bacterium]
VLGLVWVWLQAGRKVRLVRPFLGGEVPGPADDRFRVPGTHFYETVSRLPGLGPLLKHGEGGALDPYRWVGRYGHTLIELLREQHAGRIGVYVAWCILGVVATLSYLLLAAMR